MRWLALVCFVLLQIVSAPALAITVEKPLPQAAMESRAQALFSQMRCVVCEGQSLSDSDARHALDMRATIRHMVMDQKTDQEIIVFFIARYGNEVLMHPPSNLAVLPLWLAPALLLMAGCYLMYRSREKK